MSNELLVPEVNEKGLDAVARANYIVIKTNDDYSSADSFCVGLKALEKEVDEAYDEHISAAFKAHRSLVAKKNKYAEPIVEARKIIKGKMDEYRKEQDRLREAEEEKLRAQAKKEAEDLALNAAQQAQDSGNTAQAEAILAAPVVVPSIVLPKTLPKTKTPIRTVKKFRLNGKPIKTEYLTPDLVKIGQIVRALGQAAEQVVGGITVYEEAA